MTVPVSPRPTELALDRLDVYRVGVQFAASAARLRPTSATLRDQLDRASESMVLNLAEGLGRVSARERAHFFAIARGSALESASVLDILHARGLMPAAGHRDLRQLLVRFVQMVTRLMHRQTGVPICTASP